MGKTKSTAVTESVQNMNKLKSLHCYELYDDKNVKYI
jgi:hypothetical protein